MTALDPCSEFSTWFHSAAWLALVIYEHQGVPEG